MRVKGRRTKAGERTRVAILEATLRLLDREGPDAFSASSVAKEAGVSKANVFHHFDSLDELPLAALEQFWLRSLAHDTKNLRSPREFLEDLGRQVITMATTRGGFLRAQVVIATKAIFDSRLRRRLGASATQMHRAVVEELAKRLSRRLPAREIEAMARMTEMTLDGLMIALVLRPGRKQLAESKRAWSRIVDLLLARAGER